MSSRPTGTSSLTQKYCWRRREPQSLCRRLKEIFWLASVAEYSFTGIETSPKETVSDAMDRAAMAASDFTGTSCGKFNILPHIHAVVHEVISGPGRAPAPGFASAPGRRA